MDKLKLLRQRVKENSDEEKAKFLQRFFKTGKGEYAEGDKFAGIVVPVSRKIAKEFKDLNFSQIEKLLHSRIHEERLIALLILVLRYDKGEESERKNIYKLYLKNLKYVNNWDLVDLSAPKIVGRYLFNRDRKLLFKLAKSDDLWEKRISIISTYYFIQQKDFKTTIELSKILVNDDHDLIHKAVGWMLREVGKKDLQSEENFLKKYYMKMPRTMLRYAIEKFPEKKRQAYLKGKIQ